MTKATTTTLIPKDRVYREGGRHSYFHDIAAAHRGDVDAITRQGRHAQEVRVNPSGTLGQGGELGGTPAYLTEDFAPGVAGGRVIADLIGSRPLPSGRASMNLPRVVGVAGEAVQPVQGGAGTSTDPTTGFVQAPVVTIDGFVDVSIQLQDLAPGEFDHLAAIELQESFNAALDLQLFNGTGAGGQLTGLTNAGGTSIVGTTGTTIALLWPLIGQAVAAVGNKRLRPATALVMPPRRWAWIASSLDSSNRPIASPGNAGPRADPGPSRGDSTAVGPILGCEVWQAGAMPAQATADSIVAFRPTDCRLWESAPRLLVASNPMAGSLQVRIRFFKFVAAMTHRYPTAVAVVTGVPAPANFQ